MEVVNEEVGQRLELSWSVPTPCDDSDLGTRWHTRAGTYAELSFTARLYLDLEDQERTLLCQFSAALLICSMVEVVIRLIFVSGRRIMSAPRFRAAKALGIIGLALSVAGSQTILS